MLRLESPRRLNPASAILTGFLSALVVGTILLMLPAATVHGSQSSFIPALFTATSALCVTGLTIVDTATYWSSFGQIVIMCLIQIGGFGVMSFATVLGMAVVRRANLNVNLVSAAERHSPLGAVRPLLQKIFLGSLLIEALIAFALITRFLFLGYPVVRALWHGIFHAISSFNNAGFALYSDNMAGFVGDWAICVPLMFGIILGGLGFPVLFQLRRDIAYPYKWSLHTRMVLWGTLGLLLISIFSITILEWRNPHTLGALSTSDSFLAGIFQAVQTRTAGFNSIDIGSFQDSTLLIMDIFMFIGGGPAGTAGGIKITTMFVLLALVWAEIRGRREVNLFGKSFTPDVYRQAVTVVTLSLFLVLFCTFLLLSASKVSLDAALFETLSAFGTVGLSTGITANLNSFAQIVLASLMIVGRLGPITVASALAFSPTKSSISLVKERPIIG